VPLSRFFVTQAVSLRERRMAFIHRKLTVCVTTRAPQADYFPLSMCQPGFTHWPLRNTKTSVTRVLTGNQCVGASWSAVASEARHRFGFRPCRQSIQSAVAASLCRRTPNRTGVLVQIRSIRDRLWLILCSADIQLYRISSLGRRRLSQGSGKYGSFEWS
jgi:hypothetical protein